MILEFNHVSLVIEQRLLLQDISFAMDAGSRCCILGPSGSGKSLLLRLAAGLTTPSRGTIRWREKNHPPLMHRDENSSGPFLAAALWPPGLLADLTVRANLVFALRRCGFPWQQWAARADHIMASLGIVDVAHVLPHELSVGEQRLVAAARALVVRPKLLLLDDPPGNVLELLGSGADETTLLPRGSALLAALSSRNEVLGGCSEIRLGN